MVSFGYLGCTLRKTPNVFLRTSEFLQWIYDKIYSEGDFKVIFRCTEYEFEPNSRE